MNHLHQHRVPKGILAGTVRLAAGVLYSATPVHAASPPVNCVVSIGVTQTGTIVTGTSANDTIDCLGAKPAKTINGNGGNDTVTGTVFADNINGNDGNDTLTGGIGADALTGGSGDDTMTGSADNDTLNGGNGNDTVTGSEGDDTLNGDANDDTLNGGTGNDSLTGPPLDGSIDTLNGGADADTCARPVLADLLTRDVLVACNP